MKNTLETRLGIFFALALIAAFLIMEMIGSFDFFRRGIRIHAQFSTVQELKEGDPVKMAGVQVGRVEKIELLQDKVDVTMKLNMPDNVRTDSKAIVKFAGLMGQNFVEIRFGSAAAPKADNNTLIKSEEQPDISMLMARLDKVASGIERVTASISGESFEKLLAPLTDFVKENSPRLTAILSNIKIISSQVAEGKGSVGKLINEDTFYQSALAAVTNLNDTAAEIKITVSQARNIVAEIGEGKGTLGKLAKDDSLYKDTSTALANLREILEKINRGQGSVGKLVNDESLYRNAKLSLQKLDKATEGLEDQGPLSILGIVVSSLF
jgi:phospholipid/cholesterol/gamma-HCH transport system substrate-binding protein